MVYYNLGFILIALVIGKKVRLQCSKLGIEVSIGLVLFYYLNIAQQYCTYIFLSDRL